jgi:hypothetical protein
MKISALGVTLCVFGLAACDKGASGSAPGASASGAKTGAAPASAAAGSCPAGAYNHSDPKFCIKLPPGGKAGQTSEGPGWKRVEFEGDDGILNVQWSEEKLEDKKAFADGMVKDNQDLGHGPLGKGYWFHIKFKDSPIHQAEIYVPGAKYLFKCYVNAGEDKAKPLVEACKTLVVD